MVSYSSCDTTSYFNQSADFRPPSAPTTNPPDSMSLQPRPSTRASAGETQNLKDLFNNHIGLAVADLFQHATGHPPLDLSCHPQNHPSIIQASSDQRSLILALQNQQTRSSPLTNQDEPSPSSPSNNHKNLTVNTSLGFETPHHSTPVHPLHLGQSTPVEPRLPQLPNGLGAPSDRPSLTPPAALSSSLFSSNCPSISPHSKHNNSPQHEQGLSSVPGSSLSRSPRTDSSSCSRHTEHSDHITTPNGEAGISSSAAYQSTAVLSRQGVSAPRGAHARTSFESVFAPKSNNDSGNTFNFSSAQSHPFQAFNDFSAIQHAQGAPGIFPKLESNTANSSPTDFGQKIFTDPRRTSTNPGSPEQLTGAEPAPPSSAGVVPPAWAQSANLGYPVSGDAYSQSQLFFTSQSIIPPAQSLPTTDRANSTANNTDHTKSAEPSPFALNHPDTSPSTGGWSGDEMNDNQPSSAAMAGNASVVDNQHLYSFSASHLPPTQQAFTPVDHSFKFGEHTGVSNSNSLGLLPPYTQPRASYMEKIPENLVVLGEPGSAGLSKLTTHPSEETGHNAVEKRYRNNINSHIAALADLVPALQHLRSLPSAATSRRHSSQFIVSTSAIGKIPVGLVDGVKAATKLSKGNILSKSVDYMRHLLRRREELKEDIEDLKDVVRSRVANGDILIVEWEAQIRLKSPQRQRQRMLEQSQGEEDGDDDDEMHDPNNKKTNGAHHSNHGPNPSKKRKVADLKIGDSNRLKGGKIYGRGIRKPGHSCDFRNQPLGPSHPESTIMASEALPPSSNPGSFAPVSVNGRQEPLGRMTHDLVDELDVLREPPSNYHHQFIAQQHNPHDYSHLQSSGFSSDFMGHPFAPVPPPEPRSQHAGGHQTRPLLAVFMGLSFAVGSGYNYHQTRSRSSDDQEAWGSPSQSRFPKGCTPPNMASSNPQAFKCHRNPANPGRGQRLLSATQASQIPHLSFSQAGLNALSIASIIWTLMFILKPEFVLNFFSPGRLRPVKRRPKHKRPVLVPGVVNGSVDSDSEDECDQPSPDGKHSFIPIDPTSLFRGDDDEKVLMGCSRKPGRLQYHRLCIIASSPNNWGSLLLELVKEAARTAGILVWGDVIEKMADLDRNGRHEGKRARIKKIKTVLAWMRIADIESLWSFGWSSSLKRLHTILKLHNLSRTLDWRDRMTREELDCGKISGVLALSLKTLFGESNRLSPIFWNKAVEAHKKDRLAIKSARCTESILPASNYRPNAQRVAEESWLNEALSLEYEEACELLAEKGEDYRLMSAAVGEFGGSRGWSPLKQIVESRAELELIEIWSRIFVSMITKTCPVEKTPRDGRIGQSQFGLDGGLAELPTRLEEAGAPYALQVSQGRRQVEQSIERICRLRLGCGSAVGRMARVTRGMWAMAFGKREVAVEVGHELKRDPGEEDEEIGCVGPYLELVLGSRLPNNRRKVERANNSTLDKLAKMTIDWLLIRREHVILHLIKGPSQRSPQETNERRTILNIKCLELRRILDLAVLESQRNRELNARSTKQSDEAIQAGEAREFDLRTAIQECQRSVFVIENQNF
ncbi:hypothetical protein PTTG_09582 [Puccinia triticina 1-1 BBBD Race 1]|uniref:BHLH domain-containing protein n=1 Tax=Puccinia triticina (isolate 1-1 / race 1 (BBBD)) TaxID=630390 RepID=A0A180G7Z5_PUCT1|nr:hypothetical protein PTTG_09582 [Puccinia triticina 1-1 BBBD Race 1]